jgi:outer membrane protein TolC
LNFNLFAGGATSSRTRLEQSELTALKTTRDKIADAVRLDVKSAYLDLQSSAKRLEVSKASAEEAKENLRLQQLQYQEGVCTATDVLDAVMRLTSAKTNSWKAKYESGRAEAGLLYSMGISLFQAYRHDGK